MSQQPETIPRKPARKDAEDYYHLRKQGVSLLEQMSSSRWTDYNSHDPGITTLEALCFAITDLVYRTGWKIEDILTPPSPPADSASPYPNQSFFSAREILTISPWTINDFRRLLINLETVRNAWVHCKECGCDLYYYAWCEENQLKLAYEQSPDPQYQPHKVEPKGLYDVMVELEADPELGDLNDRKIEHTYTVFDEDNRGHQVQLEVRFQDWGHIRKDDYTLFLDSTDAFLEQNGASFDLELLKFNRTKDEDTNMDDDELHKYWSNIFYLDFGITLQPGGEKITINNAALRIYGNTVAKKTTTVEHIESILSETRPFGLLQRYRNKLLKVEQSLSTVKKALNDHRNLCEDYCHIQAVAVEDVAVCADVEVSSNADIERVQAEIWYVLEQYFNPPVQFYTLQELIDANIPVEDIFNGPDLDCGFIKTEELESAELKTVLRISDIINLLMEIDGVITVNHLQLSKYDQEGKMSSGSSDPQWDAEGKPLFDPEKTSATWLLYIKDLHQPRLYHNQSRFRFYKNDLPFVPRMDETKDIVTQLHGQTERIKITNISHDLPFPKGSHRETIRHTPVQNSFPQTYGLGPAGLPSHVSQLRRAQMRQMKGYLMVFEQILGNAFAQLSHTPELFSLDPSISRTCFVHEYDSELIKDYEDIIESELDRSFIENLTETPGEFHERRNRFLDHLMARFGEQFNEYALLLTNLEGRQDALEHLIGEKLSFLKACPEVGNKRGKAFNHTKAPAIAGNYSGLKKRISLLLGYPDLSFSWSSVENGGVYEVSGYELRDPNQVVWIAGELSPPASDEEEELAIQKAYEQLIARMSTPTAYSIQQTDSIFHLLLEDKEGDLLGQSPQHFEHSAEAQHLQEELLSWSANERSIVVEHLLLRPKFPGDAFYPACTEGSCSTCGDEDPYSFRLTFVMPGWTVPFNTNPEARRFADRIIRQEIPAHLLGKICWVGNDDIDNPCAEVRDDLAELIHAEAKTADDERPSFEQACECADEVHSVFGGVFREWHSEMMATPIHPGSLKTLLEAELSTIVLEDIDCQLILTPMLWTEMKKILIQYFSDLTLHGMQFDYLEDAWRRWLMADRSFDWTKERAQDRVQAILEHNLETMLVGSDCTDSVCRCAAAVTAAFGTDFNKWLNDNIDNGNPPDSFTDFTPEPVVLCPDLDFKTGTKEAIEALLDDQYAAYTEVSYRLAVLVSRLGDLRNTYPGATLHDCDEGSDRNPVRLGSTALGRLHPKV